jgi:H/ACA ribonucleoprotein complex subunit 3
MLHILKCSNCKSYGLDAKCSCGSSRSKPKPPKYSPEDKYGEYRRKYKEGSDESEKNLDQNDEEED